MDFIISNWASVVAIIVFLGGLFGAKSWWPYVQFVKETADIFVKYKVINKDEVVTDQEKIAFYDEVEQAITVGGDAFKKKVEKAA